MTLKEFLDEYGRGGISFLAREAVLARSTVERAAQEIPIGVPEAKRLSAATGGKVSAILLAGLADEEVARDPDDVATARGTDR